MQTSGYNNYKGKSSKQFKRKEFLLIFSTIRGFGFCYIKKYRIYIKFLILNLSNITCN